MKKDLEKFKSADPQFRPVENPDHPNMPPDEEHREMMQKKWNEEQDEMRQNPQRDVHYQNIRYDG